jgi:peptidoglycan/xylan/chitin deacetylase (PgdA/CDA1 family)
MQRKVKRIVILAVSFMIFLLDWFWGLLRRVMGTKGPPMCVVLFYHSIPFEQREQFAEQMDTLLRYAKPISAEGTFDLTGGTRYAAVTFDDGFESVIENAVPILRKKGICATVFVVTEYLGKTASWRHFDTRLTGSERLMSVEELSMLPSDLITIGSHTSTHAMLTSLDEHAAKTEISESRLRLRQMLQRDIKLFSFPYGAFNASLVAWCREAGYTRVFTILPVPVLPNAEGYVTGRVFVEPTDWEIEFRLKLMGAYRWLPLAFTVKAKMMAAMRAFKWPARRSSAC